MVDVFASVSQVVASRYEVLVQHKHAARAHGLPATMPREAIARYIAAFSLCTATDGSEQPTDAATQLGADTQ